MKAILKEVIKYGQENHSNHRFKYIGSKLSG